ncbi:MAG: DUF4279 domain-containing protein [Spirulinaceae cyanobacterium]
MAIAYVPVVNEFFHFAVCVDLQEKRFVGIHTEPCNRVYLRAISDSLSLEKLKSLTKLSPTKSWNKGDFRNEDRSPYKYKFSSFKLLPNPEPDSFEDKLKKLLDLLETDQQGVTNLIEKAEANVTVAMNFHNGNGMLGGMSINPESIKRMGKLNLSIDFDLYADGNKFLQD